MICISGTSKNLTNYCIQILQLLKHLKKYSRFFFVLLLFGNNVKASNYLKGTVRDSLTNSPIANVYIVGNNTHSCITDSLGFFVLTVNTTKVKLDFHHTAYHQKTVQLNTSNNITIYLSPKVVYTQEVQVSSQNSSQHQQITGSFRLSGKELTLQPALMGETDVMRAVMAMPGIQSVNEGVSGLMVRGGNPGQNAITFDQIEMINPFHLLGTFSVFNPLLTNEITVFKGSAPVQYSSKLASSILIKTNDRNKNDSHFEASIGTLSSNLALQGNSKNKKLYFAIGLRRTTLELYKLAASPFIKKEENYFSNTMYSFYDLNGKVNYRLKKGLLSFTFYDGQDRFQFEDQRNNFKSAIQWGNNGAALSYGHQYNSKWYSEHTLTFNNYTFNYTGDVLLNKANFASLYNRLHAGNTFHVKLTNHDINFGLGMSRYSLTPQFITFESSNTGGSKTDKFENSNVKLFVGDSYAINPKLNMYFGVSFELFSHYGPYNYTPEDSLLSAINISEASKIITYPVFSPVVHINYKFNSLKSATLSYSHTYQNIHLGGIATIPLPSDLFMPSTRLIEPEDCHQITMGYYYQNESQSLTAQVEIFGRFFSKQLLFVPNFTLASKQNFEDHFIPGNAKSAGIEFLIKKHYPKLDVQLAYTLSKTLHQFSTIQNGNWFDAKYDRPHDVNINASYQVNDKINVYANWVFASGNNTTLPEQAYWEMGYLLFYNEKTNAYRYPAYHRLDFGADIQLKTKHLKSSILNLSVINVYNRANPYYIYFLAYMKETKYQIDIKANQVSLFPIIPSISWRIKF